MNRLYSALCLLASCLCGVVIGLSYTKVSSYSSAHETNKYVVFLDPKDQDSLFALNIINQSDHEKSWVLAGETNSILSRSLAVKEGKNLQKVAIAIENKQANVIVETVDTIKYKTKRTIGLAIHEKDNSHLVLLKKQKYYSSPKWLLALHEFAHVKGFGHSKDRCSVMYPELGGCIEAYAKILIENELNMMCIWSASELKVWGFSVTDIKDCRKTWRLKEILRSAYNGTRTVTP